MTTFEFPHPKDKLVLLQRLPVFAQCTDKQLLLVADRTRLVEYKKGEDVYRQGDPADAFYIVVSGRLRVSLRAGREEKTLTVLHNGDSFGEISLLTGETHSATVRALNDTLVLQLQKRDFEEVINRIPSLVLHLSRLLSKRLRMREGVSEYPEATIAAIYSAREGVERALLTVTLAAALKRDTNRPTVLVDLAVEDDEQVRQALEIAGPRRRSRRISVTELPLEADLWEALSEHPLGFSVLSIGPRLPHQVSDQGIVPLLNMLTKRFSYILLELPIEVDPRILKSLVQSDIIYLVTDQHRESLAPTRAFVHRLQEELPPGSQRLRVVVNKMPGIGWPVSLEALAQELGVPSVVTLPNPTMGVIQLTPEGLAVIAQHHESPYGRAVRRIARELSGSLIGLALGSGAALGLAHIGVLKVLEREKVPVDLIAGSSIGALIAGLWASGTSAADLERMALRFKNSWSIRRLFILDVRIPLFTLILGLALGAILGALMGSWLGWLFGFLACVPVGVVLGALSGGPIQGAQLMAQLERDFAGKTFEETWLPLKIIAANPMTREEIVLESGSIAEAVRASVSIPGIFKPVTRSGQVYLDGGVVNPVPVSTLRRAGAHRVIAVNVFPTTAELAAYRREAAQRRAEQETRLASRKFPVRFAAWIRQEVARSVSPLVFDVIMRSMQFMEYQIAEVACHEADMTLRPTVPGAHWLEFFSPEQFIRRGEEAAMEHLAELKRLSGGLEPDVDNPEGPTVG